MLRRTPMNERYDLAVIGSGPAGQKAAIAAAKLGKRVAVIDRTGVLGGVCIHTGTIPSKTLREAVLSLTGFRVRAFHHGPEPPPKPRIRIGDLRDRVDQVVQRQTEVVYDQLRRNGVTIVEGTATFVDPNTLSVDCAGVEVARVAADYVLVACGTRPARRADIPFERLDISDADEIWEAVEGELPHSLIVVGGGVIGLEYASMMAALDIKTTLIESRPALLEFADGEIVDHLMDHLRSLGTTFLLGKQVVTVRGTRSEGVEVRLDSGETLHAESLLYAVGRQPNTDVLGLDAIGLPVDARGRLEVDAQYRTKIPHVYAAGDVVGFPALASVSMEQGRVAACNMFGRCAALSTNMLPYAIYAIPEISMVGKNEQELATAGTLYAVGVARFAELARAQILGDRTGLLKLVFDPATLRLLGVHIIGDGAAELVHIGQMVMAAGGTLETIRDTVFNYPTLAEAYKVAAFDGLNQVG